MKAYELPNNTKAGTTWTHKIVVDHTDLTQATANTAQTIALLSVVPGDVVSNVAFKLVTPFENTADSAYNTTSLILGDGVATNRYLTTTEVNKNGTEVLWGAGTNTVSWAYTAADTVDAVFGSMAAKSLSSLDTGELHVFLRVAQLSKV